MTSKINRIEIIENTKSLERHIKQLIQIEPRFAPVYKQVGTPSLRRNEGGFNELMRAMVGQQLSVAAAASIWNKLDKAGMTTPQAIKNANDDALRINGLSRQKIRYLRSLVEHDIDFVTLKTVPDDEVIATLYQF